jgi:hypothetical protein
MYASRNYGAKLLAYSQNMWEIPTSQRLLVLWGQLSRIRERLRTVFRIEPLIERKAPACYGWALVDSQVSQCTAANVSIPTDAMGTIRQIRKRLNHRGRKHLAVLLEDRRHRIEHTVAVCHAGRA